MSMEASLQPGNPFSRNKDILVKQYRLWNGYNMNKVELPPIQLIPSTASKLAGIKLNSQNTSRLNKINVNSICRAGLRLYRCESICLLFINSSSKLYSSLAIVLFKMVEDHICGFLTCMFWYYNLRL